MIFIIFILFLRFSQNDFSHAGQNISRTVQAFFMKFSQFLPFNKSYKMNESEFSCYIFFFACHGPSDNNFVAKLLRDGPKDQVIL